MSVLWRHSVTVGCLDDAPVALVLSSFKLNSSFYAQLMNIRVCVYNAAESVKNTFVIFFLFEVEWIVLFQTGL
jgi:hypothetical protein